MRNGFPLALGVAVGGALGSLLRWWLGGAIQRLTGSPLPWGTFAINASRIKQNVIDLTHDLMTLEANGGYAEAKQLMATMGVNRPETQRVLDRLMSVPVDIEPRFVTAEALVGAP